MITVLNRLWPIRNGPPEGPSHADQVRAALAELETR